jgi:hypothetical protein
MAQGSPDLILRCGPKGPRLEGWATIAVLAAILRDAALRTAPQDEAGGMAQARPYHGSLFFPASHFAPSA